MGVAVRIGTGTNAKPRYPTVVVRKPGNTVRQLFQDRVAAISTHIPARLKAFGRRPAPPRVLLVLGVFVAAFSVVTIYYYIKLAAEIDARLQGSSLDNSVAILTAPLKMSIGDH